MDNYPGLLYINTVKFIKLELVLVCDQMIQFLNTKNEKSKSFSFKSEL
jgi:hypothetical protein